MVSEFVTESVAICDGCRSYILHRNCDYIIPTSAFIH